jgi:hypothetical protein
LTGLARSAFLYLWSYPNLFRDQGKSGEGPASDGKELCDLVIVFERHVLLFSDKHCIFNQEKAPEVSWRRWYKDAILKSAAQVRGAERWLTQFPDRVYIDRACRTKLPIGLPKTPSFHRLLTCRGIAQASVNAFGGGSGSVLTTNGRLEDCIETPFHVGSLDSKGSFFHVLDEVALDAVLGSLDTVSDFCRYLEKREAFFRGHRSVLAAGEEELLGCYLWTTKESGHEFPNEPSAPMISLDGFWDEWFASKQRQAKIEADRVSYCWDRLIEKFSFHLLNGSLVGPEPAETREFEPALRWMARENRVRRRQLAESLLHIMRVVQVGQWYKRIVAPIQEGDPYWVLLAFPRPDDVEEAHYRQLRQEFLLGHCLVVKHLFPEAQDIAGIAVEPRPDSMTEDLVAIDAREWPEELASKARYFHEEVGFFSDVKRSQRIDWEYPIEGEPNEDA